MGIPIILTMINLLHVIAKNQNVSKCIVTVLPKVIYSNIQVTLVGIHANVLVVKILKIWSDKKSQIVEMTNN